MGYDEQLSKPEGRRGDPTAKFCALAAAAIFLAVTWASVLKNEPTKLGWFAFHPSLQSLAIFLLTYGILTLQPTSQPKTKAAGLARHQIAIFTLAFPLLVLGTVAVWYHKWLRGAAHLTTWHGILGSISMVWLLLQVLLGGGSVWSGGSAFGGGTKAKAVWKYHRLSGYVLLPMVFLHSSPRRGAVQLDVQIQQLWYPLDCVYNRPRVDRGHRVCSHKVVQNEVGIEGLPACFTRSRFTCKHQQKSFLPDVNIKIIYTGM